MNMIKNLILALSLFAFSQSSFADATCSGRWVNPITDVCWKCLFPMSIGNVKVSSSGLPDTRNPSSPIQACTFPPPIFKRIGIAVGFWEPTATTDITRSPMCMVNMGGINIGGLKKTVVGSSTSGGDKNRNGLFTMFIGINIL